MERVSKSQTIYPVVSTIPFRYTLDTEGRGKTESAKRMTDSIQQLISNIPEGIQKATGPQKVSRFVTGYEALLLSQIVKGVVFGSVAAIPVSLLNDGLLVLVEKRRVNELHKEQKKKLNSFSLEGIGMEMPFLL